jgi:hypothetical protein
MALNVVQLSLARIIRVEHGFEKRWGNIELSNLSIGILGGRTQHYTIARWMHLESLFFPRPDCPLARVVLAKSRQHWPLLLVLVTSTVVRQPTCAHARVLLFLASLDPCIPE